MNDFLKDYHTIDNLPFGFDFDNQDLRQLRAHEKWFFENKELRLTELQNAYHAFCGEYLDYTPESLKGLGVFFLNAIVPEKRTAEEYAELRAMYPPEIPIDDYRPTNQSKSLMVDVGIYFGEVMIRNHKNMEWKQYITKNKRDIERGYMVIVINSNKYMSWLNPIWVVNVMGSKVLDKTFPVNGIFNLYNIYCEKVDSKYIR